MGRKKTLVRILKRLYTKLKLSADVRQLYKELKKKNIDIEIDIRNDPWGDRHFAIQDLNGIGIDVVKYSPDEK